MDNEVSNFNIKSLLQVHNLTLNAAQNDLLCLKLNFLRTTAEADYFSH